MFGVNKMEIGQATMITAVQEYLEKRCVTFRGDTPFKVVSVKALSASRMPDKFVIELEPQKASPK